jgi:hypothetical protein
MHAPSVPATSTSPTAHRGNLYKRCNHPVHVGTCPQCQRAQLARWAEQLADATRKNG